MEREKVLIEAKKFDLDANKEVVLDETRWVWEKEESNNQLITDCTNCKKTCHSECGARYKYFCSMMKDGHCSICNCPWGDHRNVNYIWRKKKKTFSKSNWDDNEDKKSRYDKAWNEMSRSEKVIANKEQEIKRKEEKVQILIGAVLGCIQNLEKIALRPLVTTVEKYIDQLIAVENDKPNKNAKRVKKLKDYKKMEEIIEKIQKNGGKNIAIKDLYE